MSKEHRILKALRAAFPVTVPILMGFLFLGAAYGIYMTQAGFSPVYPIIMSAAIFAGSMEFLTVNLLLGAFDPLRALILTLTVNARHLFYGISMLDKYRDTGRKKTYLIFGMCDESFSINLTADIPPDIDKGLFMFFVTLLNHGYWVCGAAIGGLFGAFIRFNTEGIEFVMTALFIVIFLDQWLKEDVHYSSLAGLGISFLCLVIFGEGFIIPAMLLILAALTAFRKPLEKAWLR